MKRENVRSERGVSSSDKAFRTFEDLQAYKVAREFRRAMYPVARDLPEVEKYGLAGQIRRAAVSRTNNIAEGHGRCHFLDQIKFCMNARGSLEELIDDLNVCEDESYLSATELVLLRQQGWRVHQLLNGYIRYLRERKAGTSISLREPSQTYGLPDDELDGRLNDASLQQFNPSTI